MFGIIKLILYLCVNKNKQKDYEKYPFITNGSIKYK